MTRGDGVNRRDFLKCSGLVAGGMAAPWLAASAWAEEAAAKRLNILWLMAEDLGCDLGCYGAPVVKTPHIDRLAAEGIRFTNAFTTAPVCSPSRSAMITGMYQTSIGCHHHRSHRGDGYVLPKPVRTITDLFREAGYFTADVKGTSKGARATGKTDFNFTDPKPFDGADWSERKAGQPFYAQLSFQETHRRYTPDTRAPISPADVVLPPYYPDHPVARKDWAEYLGAVQVLDRNVGAVLKALEDEGIADRTVVLFFGDNGRSDVRGKQWLYEGGIHVPLIVRLPGAMKRTGVSDDLVASIDFSATSLKLAGIEPPAWMQGQVFLGPGANRRDYVVAARDRCDETVDCIRCVRTKQFKYIRNFMPDRPWTQPNAYKERSYPMLNLLKDLHAEGKLSPDQDRFMAPRRPPEELYDLAADPHELHNLADLPPHRETLERLRGILSAWMKETRDQGATPEGPIPEKPESRSP